MIEFLFLLLWSLAAAGGAALVMMRMKAHSKVYLVMVISWAYLTVLFWAFPKLPGWFGP